jgi:DNA/RNA-binding domain of Phe-tRNA-synthetase-like protein
MKLELDHPTICLGLVSADDVHVAPSSPALLAQLAASEQALTEDPARFPEHVRSELRNVLRKGGYKPTGRGKPASEYLLGQALARTLPRLNNLVDICNLVSLHSAFPISVCDADRLGSDIALRFGRPGEQYVFNASGQSMDIAGLPVVARGPEREPVANAVKDSMVCKVHAETRRALYVVYGRTLLRAELSACLQALSHNLQRGTGSNQLAAVIVPAAP